jgi:uncharacterized protein
MEIRPGAGYGEIEPPGDGRTFAMLCHLSALFIGFLGPLIFWLIKRDENAFVDDQGKEALNFHITVAIASVVTFVLCFVIIGFLLIPVVAVGTLVLTIMASVKANEGVRYRYPLCLRLIK